MRRLRGALVAGILGSASWWFGCSVALPGELERVECRDEGAVGPPACDPGEACQSGVCTVCLADEVCGNRVDDDCNGQVDDGCGAEGYGEACAADPDCADGFLCADSVCTRGCCRSEDCAAGWVCATGRLCKAASVLGRQVGLGRAGEVCSEDGECRSGVCEASRCIDQCCSNADCGADMSCVVDPNGNICRVRTGLNYGSTCSDNDQCSAALCRTVGAAKLCSQPCCAASDCGTFNVGGLRISLACAYPDGIGAGCVAGDFGALGVGEECSGNEQCRSGMCLSGRCSDACCGDADCPAPGYRCRIDADGRGYCLP